MNRKEGNIKSYTLMKTFMRTEYNNLDKVGGLTIASSNLNQAKHSTRVKRPSRRNVRAHENNLNINMVEILTGLCGQMKNEENIPPQQEMNSANNIKSYIWQQQYHLSTVNCPSE